VLTHTILSPAVLGADALLFVVLPLHTQLSLDAAPRRLRWSVARTCCRVLHSRPSRRCRFRRDTLTPCPMLVPTHAM